MPVRERARKFDRKNSVDVEKSGRLEALRVAPEVVQEAQETLEDVEEVETKEEVALQSKFTGKRPR